MQEHPSRFRARPAARAATIALATGCLALLAGCVTPLRSTAPAAEADPAVQATAAALVAGTAGWPDASWWTAFGDPQLDRVIEQALAANPDLATARSRARALAAAAGVESARLLPSAEGSARVTRQRLSETGLVPPPYGGRWITNGALSAQLAWNLDLSGAERDRVAAARGEAEAARLDAVHARGATAVAAAKLYFELLAAFADRDVVQAQLAQRRQVLSITAGRVRAGLDSPAELRSSEAQVPTLELELAQAEERVALARSQLALLAGQPPAWAADLASPGQAQVSAEWGIPQDLSAALLARRVDVLAARERVTAAARRVDASRRDWFPNLNLAAGAGLDSVLLDSLFDAGSRTFSLGPALSLPLFDAGRRRNTTAARLREFEMAEAEYRKAVLGAVRDVSDAVTRLNSSAEQLGSAAAAIAAEREALRLAQLRYDKGLAPLLQVLVEQERVLALERRVAALAARERGLRVELQEALGAGLPLDSGEMR